MIREEAERLKEPLPVLSALSQRASALGVKLPLHKTLAFVLGSSVALEEYRQFDMVLSEWFESFGLDLAQELGIDYAELASSLGFTAQNKPQEVDFW